jgi:hypothetical protein
VSEGINMSESMNSDIEMFNGIENEQSGVSASSDWEMDEESFEQGSEEDSTDEELTYLTPNPTHSRSTTCSHSQHSPFPDKPRATLASSPSNASVELTSKPTVKSAI